MQGPILREGRRQYKNTKNDFWIPDIIVIREMLVSIIEELRILSPSSRERKPSNSFYEWYEQLPLRRLSVSDRSSQEWRPAQGKRIRSARALHWSNVAI